MCKHSLANLWVRKFDKENEILQCDHSPQHVIYILIYEKIDIKIGLTLNYE